MIFGNTTNTHVSLASNNNMPDFIRFKNMKFALSWKLCHVFAVENNTLCYYVFTVAYRLLGYSGILATGARRWQHLFIL